MSNQKMIEQISEYVSKNTKAINYLSGLACTQVVDHLSEVSNELERFSCDLDSYGDDILSLHNKLLNGGF